MTAGCFKQLMFQRVRIGQIAVMRQSDTER